jgi:uncharacterized protein YbaP (TraB family)
MKNAIVAVLLIGVCATAYGQDKALLYEVSGKGLSQPSYLYGTFHMVCPADLKLTSATSRAMSASQQVYLELDMDDPRMKTTAMQAMMLPGGKNLKEFMSVADYAVLDRYLTQNAGAGLAQLGSLKPLALVAILYEGILDCQPRSYDQTFAQMAGNARKPVLGLETVEQQMAIFDKVPMQDQIKALVEIARRPEEAKKEITMLMAAYKAQDLPQLMKLTEESEFNTESPEFMDELLAKRNANWIPIIERAARAKATFFAFGAAHLGGEDGVVNLLRAKGYAVKAIQ